MKRFSRLLTTATVVVVCGVPADVSAQAAGAAVAPASSSEMAEASEVTWLGTVEVPRAVLANGERLEAGGYRVRLTGEVASDVVGQGPSSERWVEFVRDGKAMGRELAPFVESSDVGAVTPPSSVPAQGASRVQALRGAEYLRIWFNSDGDQVLIYLPWADAK